jgi:hypothetical protein
MLSEAYTARAVLIPFLVGDLALWHAFDRGWFKA